MTNRFFNTEELSQNDLYFLCYMIERVARKLHQPNKYVVNALGYDELYRQLSLASVLHCENPFQVEQDWIEQNSLHSGAVDVTKVRADLDVTVPTASQIAKVYKRLILSVAGESGDWVRTLIKVYNNPICRKIDDYNTSAFYQPSPVILKAYSEGAF